MPVARFVKDYVDSHTTVVDLTHSPASAVSSRSCPATPATPSAAVMHNGIPTTFNVRPGVASVAAIDALCASHTMQRRLQAIYASHLAARTAERSQGQQPLSHRMRSRDVARLLRWAMLRRFCGTVTCERACVAKRNEASTSATAGSGEPAAASGDSTTASTTAAPTTPHDIHSSAWVDRYRPQAAWQASG